MSPLLAETLFACILKKMPATAMLAIRIKNKGSFLFLVGFGFIDCSFR
jgi:hypothetical protein